MQVRAFRTVIFSRKLERHWQDITNKGGVLALGALKMLPVLVPCVSSCEGSDHPLLLTRLMFLTMSISYFTFSYFGI